MKVDYSSNIWKLYFLKFLTSLHFIAGVLVPFFTLYGEVSFQEIMIIQSVFVFSIFIFEVPTGAIADKFGRKTSIAIGCIFVTLGGITYSIYPNFYIFMLAEFIWGIGYSLMSGADEAFMYDSLKKLGKEKESKKMLGRLSTADLAGIAIAAPIGSFIGNYIGMRYVTLMMLVPLTISFFIALSLREPPIGQKRKASSFRKYLNIISEGLKHFKRKKELRIIAFDAVSNTVLVFMMIWLYQKHLMELGVGIIYFGFIHMGMVIVEIIALNNFEKLEYFSGSKKNFMLFSALISGIGFIIAALSKNHFVIIFFMILVIGIGLPRYVLMRNYINKHTRSSERATVLSAVSMLRSMFVLIGYNLIGFGAKLSTAYTFLVIGTLIIVFAVISRVEEKHLID